MEGSFAMMIRSESVQDVQRDTAAFLHRLSEAKTEKIIREFEVSDSTSRAGA
jgi:hypothetical protein